MNRDFNPSRPPGIAGVDGDDHGAGGPHSVGRPIWLPFPGPLLPRPPAWPRTMHTTLVASDISGFGDQRRDDETHLHLRQGMYALLADAFTMTGLAWWDCYREDRGDGALIIAPPGSPPAAFLDPLAHHLTALLRRHNRLASDIGRIRLRVAVHSGQVHHDAYGLVGRPLIHLFRLLEAKAFKKAFAAAGTDLGMIVSAETYREAAATSGLINDDAYRQLRVTCKETRAQARLWLPPTPV